MFSGTAVTPVNLSGWLEMTCRLIVRTRVDKETKTAT